MRMAETSEWHRRMTAEKISQTGRFGNVASQYANWIKAYVYKPPSQQEVIRKGRMVKHIDHYVGPGRIIKHIGK